MSSIQQHGCTELDCVWRVKNYFRLFVISGYQVTVVARLAMKITNVNDLVSRNKLCRYVDESFLYLTQVTRHTLWPSVWNVRFITYYNNSNIKGKASLDQCNIGVLELVYKQKLPPFYTIAIVEFISHVRNIYIARLEFLFSASI